VIPLKKLIPAALAGLFGTLILVSVADAARQSVLMRLLDSGIPRVKDGDRPLLIRRIVWQGGDEFTFKDYSDTVQVLTLDGWNIRFSSKPLEASYDPTCGVDCPRAVVVRGMSCEPPYLMTLSMSSFAACRLHIWSRSGFAQGPSDCFFSIESDVPVRSMDLGPIVGPTSAKLPQELHFQCPASLSWVPASHGEQ
jgi:hypothetical protein